MPPSAPGWTRCWPPTHEIPAVIHALDGGYIRPAPGGDLLRTTDVLPTGRNLHGFDPFRLPSAFAVQDGARQADRLLARTRPTARPCPETVAMVLWGTDNLKTEGGPIAQALWLMGAEPRLRQLWPAVRCAAGPAGDAGPAPGRCGDHAVRHLPRPAAAADQAAGGGRAASPRPPTSRWSRTSSASTPWISWPRMAAPGGRGAAGVRQCGRRLRRERQRSWSVKAPGTTKTSWPRPTSSAKASPMA